MGNLVSCVLICGAVEVVHVVHSDGHVERLIRPLDSSKNHHPNNVMKKRLSGRSSNSSPCSPSSSPSQADLMNCFANLSKTPLDPSDALGRSYLLLPIRNAAAAGAESAPVFKYKRFSSFQFYKSALLSPASILKSSSSHHHKSLSAPSSSNAAASKLKSSSSASSSSSRKTHNPSVVPVHHSHHQDDRKHLLLKDSSSSSSIQQQPFKVRQEGGVTKLVVSKKYLAQLLSESNMKKSSTASGISGISNVASGASASSVLKSVSSSHSAPARIGRPGVWRPALESISEAANHAAQASATSTIAPTFLARCQDSNAPSF